MMFPNPKRIAITGAAGQICYSLLFRRPFNVEKSV